VALGPQHAFVGIGHHNLGLVRREAGEIEPARGSLEKAVQLCMHSIGTLHSDTRAAVDSLRAFLEELGEGTDDSDTLVHAEATTRTDALRNIQTQWRRRQWRLRWRIANAGRLPGSQHLLLDALLAARDASWQVVR
jgi:hypothetical protein